MHLGLWKDFELSSTRYLYSASLTVWHSLVQVTDENDGFILLTIHASIYSDTSSPMSFATKSLPS